MKHVNKFFRIWKIQIMICNLHTHTHTHTQIHFGFNSSLLEEKHFPWHLSLQLLLKKL